MNNKGSVIKEWVLNIKRQCKQQDASFKYWGLGADKVIRYKRRRIQSFEVPNWNLKRDRAIEVNICIIGAFVKTRGPRRN